jgi:transcriptional regulator with XRE-family HTH domain
MLASDLAAGLSSDDPLWLSFARSPSEAAEIESAMPRPARRPKDARAPSDLDAYIGSRVRQRRVTLGVTQQEAAKAIGVPFQQLQRYEGGTNRISASRLFALAHALAVPITWFYEGMDAPGGRGRKSELLDLARDPETLRFIIVYYRIKDARARQRLREMASVLAGGK